MAARYRSPGKTIPPHSWAGPSSPASPAHPMPAASSQAGRLAPGNFPHAVHQSVSQHALVACPTRCAAQARSLPLIVQGHSWGVQVGVLHGLHLWAAQEVVECVEGVGGPGDGLGRLAGLTGGAGAGAQRVAPLHVVHGSGNQVTWRGEQKGGRERQRKQPEFTAVFFPDSLSETSPAPW